MDALKEMEHDPWWPDARCNAWEPEMNLHELAAFWRALGKRVFEADDVLWLGDTFKSVYFTFPFDKPLDIRPRDVRRLLWKQRGLLARVTREQESGTFNSYLYICDNREYDFPALAKHRRSVVRKGYKQAEHIGPVDKEIILRDGYALETESLERQGRKANIPSRTEWNTYMRPWLETPDAYCWGAVHDGKLVAYMLVVNIRDDAEIHNHRSGGVAMKTGINNAMVFELVRRTVIEQGMRRLSYGLASIRDIATLDWFKESMGFRRVPIRQEFIPHPLLRPFLARPLLRLTGGLIQRLTDNDDARKVAATLALMAGDEVDTTTDDDAQDESTKASDSREPAKV